jgi:hypothetical protein
VTRKTDLILRVTPLPKKKYTKLQDLAPGDVFLPASEWARRHGWHMYTDVATCTVLQLTTGQVCSSWDIDVGPEDLVEIAAKVEILVTRDTDL